MANFNSKPPHEMKAAGNVIAPAPVASTTKVNPSPFITRTERDATASTMNKRLSVMPARGGMRGEQEAV
jgi:hypothetical protein